MTTRANHDSTTDEALNRFKEEIYNGTTVSGAFSVLDDMELTVQGHRAARDELSGYAMRVYSFDYDNECFVE